MAAANRARGTIVRRSTPPFRNAPLISFRPTGENPTQHFTTATWETAADG
jgi:hypothetical protein